VDDLGQRRPELARRRRDATPAGTGGFFLPGPGLLWPPAGGILPAFDPDSRLRTYRAAGEVFPTARLGVRLGYTRPDGEGLYSNDGGYDLAATWFFKPRVGVQFSYAESLTQIDSHVRLIGRFRTAPASGLRRVRALASRLEFFRRAETVTCARHTSCSGRRARASAS
jgi:hypothetical protein